MWQQAAPRACALASAMAVLLFASTVSFLFTTPGATAAASGGFPVLSVLPSQLLLKDLVLACATRWASSAPGTAHGGERRR